MMPTIEVVDSKLRPSVKLMKSSLRLKDILDEYKRLGLELQTLSTKIPKTSEEADALMQDETVFLNQQLLLIDQVLSAPITSNEDVQALLAFWYHEVVECQAESSLRGSDLMVRSVCQFYKIAEAGT